MSFFDIFSTSSPIFFFWLRVFLFLPHLCQRSEIIIYTQQHSSYQPTEWKRVLSFSKTFSNGHVNKQRVNELALYNLYETEESRGDGVFAQIHSLCSFHFLQTVIENNKTLKWRLFSRRKRDKCFLKYKMTHSKHIYISSKNIFWAIWLDGFICFVSAQQRLFW